MQGGGGHYKIQENRTTIQINTLLKYVLQTVLKVGC